MSYLKNTLNFASYSYDASTDTPALAKMKDGTVFEVATAGKVVGTAISGCTLGADSYLLVGDKVVYKNGGHELLSPKIKNGTTINVGTGGLFTKFKDANDYISQRVYTGVILNLLSTTVETSSIDVQNPCGGRLVIMGNGFFIDHSGTVNTNCTLSGNNIYTDDFKVKANAYIGATVTTGALEVHGNVTHDNGVNVQNIHANGSAFILAEGGKFTGLSVNGRPATTANITLTCSVNTNYASLAQSGAYFSAHNVTTVGHFHGGNSCSNYIIGAINTGGGQFYAGWSCSNSFAGAITTGGGQFYAGASCSNSFGGAITTGGGQFHGGNSCSNIFVGAITTGGGQFHGGNSCSNIFVGLVNCGAGQLDFGTGTSNLWTGGAIATGGVNALSGSQNNCNFQPMPVGTPASGTNTAAFTRVG